MSLPLYEYLVSERKIAKSLVLAVGLPYLTLALHPKPYPKAQQL